MLPKFSILRNTSAPLLLPKCSFEEMTKRGGALTPHILSTTQKVQILTVFEFFNPLYMIFMAKTQSITLAGMLRARFLTAFKRLQIFTDWSPSRPHAARTISSSFCLHSEGLVTTQEQFRGACRHSAGRIMPI